MGNDTAEGVQHSRVSLSPLKIRFAVQSQDVAGKRVPGRVSSLRPHAQTMHSELTDTEVKSITHNIRIYLPHSSAKDIDVILSIFQAKMAKQDV